MTRTLFYLAIAGIALFVVAPLSFADEPTGDDYLEYHKPILGTWKVTIQEGEKVYSGTATWELGAKGKCFVVQLDAEGLPALQGLIGYDPVNKKIVQTIYDASGTYSVSMLQMTDMAKGKKMSVGKVGTWDIKRFQPDGKMTSGTESFSCLEFSKKQIVFVWSDRKQDGKSLPDWKLSYERP